MVFKFLDPFQKEDKDFFFGREEEIDSLFEMVEATRLTVVYGPSGVGKTSLIKCGLENKFPEIDWKFIYIRRLGVGDITKALFRAVRDTGYTYIESEYPDFPIARLLRSVYNDIYKSLILVFDQFEEIFLNNSDSEIIEFQKNLKTLLNSEIDLRIIVVIRDDFFGQLEVFERSIPTIYRNKLRLERISPKNLEIVVQKMIENKLQVLPENLHALAAAIVSNVKDKKSGIVELPFLQVYLEELQDLAIKNSSNISMNIINKVGNFDNVLEHMLDRQIKTIASEEKIDHALVRSVLNCMVAWNGTKIGRSFSDIMKNTIKEELHNKKLL